MHGSLLECVNDLEHFVSVAERDQNNIDPAICERLAALLERLQTRSSDHLSLLPPELLVHILVSGTCTFRDVLHLELTCKFWCNASRGSENAIEPRVGPLGA